MEICSASGASKQAIHFGAQGRPLFGFYHPPGPGLWRGVGVVLCRPIGTDQTRSDRVYRHLAERLVAAGFAFPCFELHAHSGAERIALFGMRLGATLAFAHAAERGDVDALVLWSPWVSGARFVDEVTKLHKLYLNIQTQMASAFPKRADGEEALGMLLPRALIEDLSLIDLLETTRRPARRTLIIDGGNVPGRDGLMAHLRQLGAAPELQAHQGHKFLITTSDRALLPDEVIDSIVGWLKDVYPVCTAPAGPAQGPSGPAPSGERFVRIREKQPLFGIFTPADPLRAGTRRPPILITNAGSVNRCGPHRLYVKMARRWAQLGFDVLRFDLSGIGDSPVAPGARENLTYPPGGLEDLGAAIHSLGAERVIVAGLCSGGDYAFQLGARDPTVVGSCMLNPRTFCVLDLAAVDSADDAPPSTPVEEVPRTLRRMADRGVDALLVVSHNDPGVAYVDAHAGDEMRALAGVRGFQRVDFGSSDHTFTPIAAQDRLNGVVMEHLLARY